jgi:hypothetical protein
LTYALILVEPENVNKVWAGVEKMIAAAMEKLNIGDLGVTKRELLAGEALLWLAWNGEDVKAAAVTQIGKANGTKVCTIVGCGGHGIKEWLPLIAGLEVYAAQENCRAMRIIGRPGWKRALPDYKPIGIVLERTLQ